MIFTETKLKGAFIIDLERREDDRGFFARAFCQHEFEEHGLEAADRPGQPRLQPRRRARCAACTSSIRRRPETKLVRCTAGRDPRHHRGPAARSRRRYLEHVAVELTADNHRALYVPERFAHGYQVLADGTETSYQVGEFYAPAAERGLRYDDPRLGLDWPLPGHRDLGRRTASCGACSSEVRAPRSASEMRDRDGRGATR